MKFLRFFYSSSTLLVLLFLSPALLQTGCGSDEAESEPEEEEQTCRELHSGTIKAGDKLRDEFGITSLAYDISTEEQILLTARDDDDEAVGDMHISFLDPADQTGHMYTEMQYVPESGETVTFSHEANVIAAGTQIDATSSPLIAQEIAIEKGDLVWGARLLGELKHGDFQSASESNPMIEQRSVSLFRQNGDSPIERVELALDADEDELTEIVEQWAEGSGIEEQFEATEMGQAFAIMSETKIYEKLSDIYQACQSSYRGGNDAIATRSQSLQGGLCGEMYEVGAFMELSGKVGQTGVGLGAWYFAGGGVFGLAMIGAGVVSSVLPPGWAFAVGLVLAGVLAAKVGMGIALVVLAVFAVRWIGSAVVAEADRICGNPMIVSSDGTAIPFHGRGEFVWTRDPRAPDGFEIQVRSERNRGSTCDAGAYLTGVAARVGEHRVGIYPQEDIPLWIDGIPQSDFDRVQSLGDGGVIQKRDTGNHAGDTTYAIRWSSGAELVVDLFDDRLDLDLNLPDDFTQSREGLVGDRNGTLGLRDGGTLEEPVSWRALHERFADGWRVRPEESLFDYSMGYTPDDGYPATPRSLDDLSKEQREQALQVCRDQGGINDPILLRHCVLDVGCTGDNSYVRSYMHTQPPARTLQLIDEDGNYIGGRISDDSDLLNGPSVGGSISSGGPDFGTVEMASCPADIENNAESIGLSAIRTIDGYSYDFRASGEFVLMESRNDDGLAIHIRQEPTGEGVCPYARRNTGVGVQMGDHVLGFYARDEDRIVIDGTPVNDLGGFEVLEGGHTILQLDLDNYLMEWPDRTWLHIEFKNDRINIQFNAHYSRLGQLQGIFGQFNGYPDNDLALRGGADLDDWGGPSVHGEYADSWRISDEESLLEYGDGETTADYTDGSVPEMHMTSADVPGAEETTARQHCEDAGVTHPKIMDDCIVDVYCTGDPDVAMEHAIREDPNNKEWVEEVPGSGDYCCHVDCLGGPDPECGFICGTEQFEEPHEWCDGDCPTHDDDCADQFSGDSCTVGVMEKAFDDAQISAYICATRCVEQVQTQCIDGDGCCPPGGQCTSATDNSCDIDPQIGSGCTDDEHCSVLGDDAPDPSMVHCIAEEWSGTFGGFCTVLGCAEDSQCPDDSHCATNSLHLGAAGQIPSGNETSHICVESCSSDAECPREGYGCYDADGDGRNECWHTGTGSQDFGEDCETSRDCGAIGDYAVCGVDYGTNGNSSGTADTFCTKRCGVNGEGCPADWECDSSYGVCLQPLSNDIGTSCDTRGDCDSATNNFSSADRCLGASDDEGMVMNGGYCSTLCSDDNDCPTGSSCSGEDELFDDTGSYILFSHCVLDCDTDADCPRDDYGCYDTNFDGTKECWQIGTGPKDYGDQCQWASECGEVGEHAICKTEVDDNGDEEDFGTCTSFCGNSGTCPDGWRCAEQSFGFAQTCVPESENDLIGEGCTDESQCGEAPEDGFLQVVCHGDDGEAMPGGYCSIANCNDDVPCPAGSHCEAAADLYDSYGGGFFSGSCVASCDSDADCPRADYSCYDATNDGTKECWHIGTGSAGYGDDCQTGAECSMGEGAVCHQGSTGSGRCTSMCHDDPTACPSGYGCSSIFNRCTIECVDDEDCPELSSCLDDMITNLDGTTSPGCL